MAIRVLLVDDTDHVRQMLSQMLILDGFEIAGTASSGEEGLTLAQTSAPDVIVMDFKMPKMDGIATTRALREKFPDLPVILYTAYVDSELEKRAREAGVNVCVAKVQGLSTLERQISQLCLELA